MIIETRAALELIRDTTDSPAVKRVLSSVLFELDILYHIASRAICIAEAPTLGSNSAYEQRYLQEILDLHKQLGGDRSD